MHSEMVLLPFGCRIFVGVTHEHTPLALSGSVADSRL